MSLRRIRTSSPCGQQRAFTLIELLTVIAIIGILAAIIVPTVGAVRTRAKTLSCATNLRAWGQAVRLLANDYKGNIALTTNLGSVANNSGPGYLYSPYFSDSKVNAGQFTDRSTGSTLDAMSAHLRCPAYEAGDGTEANTRRQYLFIAPIGTKKLSGDGFGRTSVAGMKYYNISDCTHPSTLMLMIDTTATPNDQTIGDGTSKTPSSITNDLKDKVQPICLNTGDKAEVRHGGVVNVLYLDGHVTSLKWQNLDASSIPPAERSAFNAQFYLTYQ